MRQARSAFLGLPECPTGPVRGISRLDGRWDPSTAARQGSKAVNGTRLAAAALGSTGRSFDAFLACSSFDQLPSIPPLPSSPLPVQFFFSFIAQPPDWRVPTEGLGTCTDKCENAAQGEPGTCPAGAQRSNSVSLTLIRLFGTPCFPNSARALTGWYACSLFFFLFFPSCGYHRDSNHGF